jgi:enediyne biosynthesis protein E4
MNVNNNNCTFTILCFGLLLSCSLPACNSKKDTLFKQLHTSQTGITFQNIVVTDDSTNALLDPYIYNGGGVAIGDLNNNGLQDIILTGSMVSPKIYLNKGDFRFEDITEQSGINTNRRIHGVSLVDINSNGLLDIYFSASGTPWSDPEDRRNLLYINNGDNTFTEAAAEYGIDDTGFATHAAFLDYNGNGFLDLFLLNNSPIEFSRGESGFMIIGGRRQVNEDGLDRLYKNNGDGTFTDVSLEAGIVRTLGYGLGVAVADLNGNGWPDIYISNDMIPRDVLYINNGDGTFTDKAAEWLRHTSHSGMGIDIADFTNNGWPDILQTDMMAEDLTEKKRMSGAISYNELAAMSRQGQLTRYSINTLQMNLGVDDNENVIFSEISRIAGVAYTHWTWSALFADLDNDGFKDIVITNGFPVAGQDYDHLTELHNAQVDGDPEGTIKRKIEIFENVWSYKVPNYLFRNNGDLTFTDKSDAWGMNEPGYSYGAAYADLNNNGRLDLVISNINSPVSVYQNMTPSDDSSHYLMVRLEGSPPNTGGIGAKVMVWAGGNQQYIYQNPYRGLMSSVDPRLHFGLGESSRVDSLLVIWPNQQTQLLRDIPANQLISIRQEEAAIESKTAPLIVRPINRPFQELNGVLTHTDQNRGIVDYTIQSLIPYKISRQAPPIAVGDVSGNGLDDIFIGGAAGSAGKLFIQQQDGTFIETTQNQPWQADSEHDDWDALFFDANGNGLLDLYVTSGGYHPSPVSLLLQDRLYINHGNGRFLKDTSALPQMLTSTGTVKAADFTGNGQTDLFVGGRLTPRDWPRPTRSYLLRNDGGRFTDVTADMAAELIEPGGMITDAVWIDFNDDGRPDLVTAGEWMPIRFFQNEGERFREVTQQMGLPPLRGWWNSLAAADLNGNGRMDLVAGNLGLNHTYTASPEEPFGVVAGDFSGNRTTDIILTKVIDGTEYPFYGLAKLGREIYTLPIRYNSFESFAKATIEQVVGRNAYQDALRYQADTFASVVLLNDGSGGFMVQQLPNMAQISPVYDILITDVNSDGHPDLIVAGNLYHSEPTAARADAGNGLWLKGDGTGRFTPVGPLESGLLAPGDVRSLQIVDTSGGQLLLIGNNNDQVQVFRINP